MVSEWAEKYRVLSQKASSEPGPYRVERTPYAKEPMDMLSAHVGVEHVVLMWGAQTSKTEVILNANGYFIHYAPGPALIVQPTVQVAERFSKQRVASLSETPVIAERLPKKSRDGSNTIFEKDFPGGTLILGGANSAASLCSMPVRYLSMDETARYPADVDDEGSPIELAKARTRTFARRKILEASTPTIKGRCHIESAFELTDKRRYFVPCPHCDHMQVLVWDQVRWPKGKPREAYYECEGCKEAISHDRKLWMLARGEWRATNPNHDNPKVVGYHLSALYCPFPSFTWGHAAQQYEQAEGDTAKMRVFVNTVLAETWEAKGDRPDWEKIFLRRTPYPRGKVPERAVVLTAGVDVQADRLEVEIVGWGPGMESWSIDHRVLVGAPNQDEVWQQLDAVLDDEFEHELGAAIKISRMAIDSGFSTQDVYRYCRSKPPSQVMAIKGRSGLATVLATPRKVDVTAGGVKHPGGATLWPVGVDLIKEQLYGWLRLPLPDEGEPFPRGWCHFPEYGQEFFKQLCAEQLVVRQVRGRHTYVWEKMQDRNEALDMRVYATAAAHAIGIDRWKPERWQQERAALLEAAAQHGVYDRHQPKTRKRRQSNWL